MSDHNTHEHEQKSKEHAAHAPHEEHTAGPHSPTEINPKLASDIAYWSKELHITGQKLHDLIDSHGTHVEKIRAAIKH